MYRSESKLALQARFADAKRYALCQFLFEYGGDMMAARRRRCVAINQDDR